MFGDDTLTLDALRPHLPPFRELPGPRQYHGCSPSVNGCFLCLPTHVDGWYWVHDFHMKFRFQYPVHSEDIVEALVIMGRDPRKMTWDSEESAEYSQNPIES